MTKMTQMEIADRWIAHEKCRAKYGGRAFPTEAPRGSIEASLLELLDSISQVHSDIVGNPLLDVFLSQCLRMAAAEVWYAYGTIHKNRHGNYLEYLQSDQWTQIREIVKSRDQSRCQRCGSRHVPGAPEFQVHHLDYSRRGVEALEDLQLLCPRCHEAEHSIKGGDE